MRGMEHPLGLVTTPIRTGARLRRPAVSVMGVLGWVDFGCPSLPFRTIPQPGSSPHPCEYGHSRRAEAAAVATGKRRRIGTGTRTPPWPRRPCLTRPHRRRYRIMESGQVVYVGESGGLRGRLLTHARNWAVPATCSMGGDDAGHRGVSTARDREIDLIGAFFVELGAVR